MAPSHTLINRQSYVQLSRLVSESTYYFWPFAVQRSESVPRTSSDCGVFNCHAQSWYVLYAVLFCYNIRRSPATGESNTDLLVELQKLTGRFGFWFCPTGTSHKWNEQNGIYQFHFFFRILLSRTRNEWSEVILRKQCTLYIRFGFPNNQRQGTTNIESRPSNRF